MTPTKENTLYLVIKQVYFDAILSGTKKQEFREIKGTTYKKFLDTWQNEGKVFLYVDKEKLPLYNLQKNSNNPMVYNDGNYPYIPIPYKYLDLAVGYNKDRDTMMVQIEEIHFEPMKTKNGKEARYSDDGERMIIDDNGELCIWQIVYSLGSIIDTDLKIDRARG